MIDVTQQNCTACTACSSICPNKCIYFEPDQEGFLVAMVKKEKCIECNLCEKVCPELNRKQEVKKGTVYAFKTKDNEVRKESSSGGFFFTLAKKVIEMKGIVCGVVYDEELVVHHKCVDYIEGVKKMMGSKYVQSDLRKVFTQIKEYLQLDRLVLFTGTPCQVMGLLNFLGKEYDKLITIQLICHGVPSPLLFEKYKDYLKEKYKVSSVKNIVFRKNNKFIIGFRGDSLNKKWKGSIDLYLRPFIKGINYRMCCYRCQYPQKHIADYTIGDFWGLEKFKPEFCDGYGNSIVMVNSLKAEKWLNYFENVEYASMDYDIAALNNSNLLRPTEFNQERETFYQGVEERNYITSLKKHVPLTAKVASLLPYDMRDKIKEMSSRNE